MNMNTNIKLETIIRTVCLVLALVNQALMMAGHNILPVTDEQVAEFLTLAFTIVASLWAWWKNNSFTTAAQAGDKIMKAVKKGEISASVVDNVLK